MYLTFPTHCMSCPSGFMVGMKDENKGIYCVVSVVSPSQAKDLPSKDFSIIGLWNHYDSALEEAKTEEHALVLLLHRGEKMPRIFSIIKEVVVILYDQPSRFTFFTIHPVNLRCNTKHNDSGLTDEQSEIQSPLLFPEIKKHSCIEEIINYINVTQDPKVNVPFQRCTTRFIQEYVSRFLCWIMLLPYLILSFLSCTSNFLMAILKPQPAKYLISLSELCKQFSLRLKQISVVGKQSVLKTSNSMVYDIQELRMTQKRHLHQKQTEFLIKGNLLTIIALDVILGVLVVTWLTSTNTIVGMADYLLQNTENVAQQLIQLIHWLMGVPAGLKLNKTLTNFLGKFFLYHIYLWQIYLKIIAPYLQTLLWMCILSGYLGITFLISLASDILSLLTLHIYCFYVYAARVYSLLVYTLLSLARLFMGKKWNVLQNRVDSLTYDVDRLFIGTLLFTVLFFLLPTTALFYVVFTSLRLLVYVFKYFLSCATHLMNKLPLFGIMLLFFSSSMLPGGLDVGILKNPFVKATPPILFQLSSILPQANSVLYLKLSNKPLSISQLVNWSIHADQKSDSEQDLWSTFLDKLLRGHLVYPWIKRNGS